MSKRVDPKSIDDLPPELLAHIFSLYAGTEGTAKLYSILAKVSLKWKKTASTPNLWTKASFTTRDFLNGHLWLKDKDIKEQLSMVKTLNFKFNPRTVLEPDIVHAALEQILGSSGNLEIFNLDCKQDIEAPRFFLFDLPNLCVKIREIQIENVCHLSNENMLLRWIKEYNSNLIKLVIRNSYLRCCTPSLLSQKIAECCPNITHLELGLVSSGPPLDLNALQAACPKMKYLTLTNLEFTDNDDLTSCFPQLEKFCFKPSPFTFFDHKMQQDVMRALRGSMKLEELELIDVNLQPETLLQLPCESLRKLRFQYYGEENDELYNLLCRWKHSLRELDAICDDISQQLLLRYIEHYGKSILESLSLQSYSIEMEQFKRIVRQCAKLKFLRVNEIQNLLVESVEFTTSAEIIEWLNR